MAMETFFQVMLSELHFLEPTLKTAETGWPLHAKVFNNKKREETIELFSMEAV